MSNRLANIPDAALITWAANFSQRLKAAPAAYRILPEQATEVSTAAEAFKNAYDAWQQPDTRTPSASARKRMAREELVRIAGYLVNVINTNPLTDDDQRADLKINARRKPSRVPVPDSVPVVKIGGVSGTNVRVLVQPSGGRGKPRGVVGIGLYTFAGAQASPDPEAWTFRGNTSRGRFDLPFSFAQSGGTLWVTAYWYTRTGLHGTGSEPVKVHLPVVEPVPTPGIMSGGRAAAARETSATMKVA